MRNFGALSLSHVAAYRGKSTIVSFLAESGVPVVADVTHDLGVFVLILRSTGFDLNTEAGDATGYTPLLCAVVSIIEHLSCSIVERR